ncbi:MAG TPA: IS701 family transposase [Chloroflexota bacterium]|nr:IS701 family transposase [Chloroflexota bacterium]
MIALEEIAGWAEQLENLHGRIRGRFARSEQRNRSRAYLKGLLSPVERKNSWQLAEQIGEATPDGVQRLLNAADWDAEAVREDLRAYVVEHLGDEKAVLVLDETGFLKKGTKSVGVQRQYSGTAGRIENCQIGVFLCYANPKGAVLLDRCLYLPEQWAQDPERRREAGVPEEVEFATKPALAKVMVERALEAGVPCGFVTGDSVYGSDRRLRLFLEERGVAFVLAVTGNEALLVGFGQYARPAKMVQTIAESEWQRLSVREGAKGPRLYDWAWVPLWRLQVTEEDRAKGHWLLVRRSLDTPGELTFYVAFGPHEGTTLESLARVAGMRWNVESCFEAAKGECGLDQYEVRKWNAWHRHITLSMLAQAFLVVARGGGLAATGQAKKGAVGQMENPVQDRNRCTTCCP